MFPFGEIISVEFFTVKKVQNSFNTKKTWPAEKKLSSAESSIAQRELLKPFLKNVCWESNVYDQFYKFKIKFCSLYQKSSIFNEAYPVHVGTPNNDSNSYCTIFRVQKFAATNENILKLQPIATRL